jgi:hypothetical protein
MAGATEMTSFATSSFTQQYADSSAYDMSLSNEQHSYDKESKCMCDGESMSPSSKEVLERRVSFNKEVC